MRWGERYKNEGNVTPTEKKNETKTVIITYIFYNYVSSNLLNVFFTPFLISNAHFILEPL